MAKNYRNTAVGIIVNKEKKILICLSDRDDNDWKFPQGGIEEGEIAREAIKRELKEELSIDLRNEQIQREGSGVSYFFNSGFEIRLHPFLIKYEGEPIKISPEEFCEYKWIVPSEILGLQLGVRKEAYLKILEELAV